MDLSLRIRKNIRELKPYSSARDEFAGQADVMLDANENPYNTPLNRYPDPHQTEIRKRIAVLKGIEPEQIFLGNGSDEAIDLLFRIFCEPGRDNVVSIVPTYGMYRVAADINDIRVKEVLLREDFSLDAASVLAACDPHTKLIFLCSPNNPTGNSLDTDQILRIVKESNSIVVLDEAYIDFSNTPGFSSKIADYPNLVILQTFSKAWGLAGIRLGMAIAAQELISLMQRVKYPYNINSLTSAAINNALDDPEKVGKWVKMILEQRRMLENALVKSPLVRKIWSSDANFLLVSFHEPERVFNYLKGKGIIVRDRSRVPLCTGALRITVGEESENLHLLAALDELAKL